MENINQDLLQKYLIVSKQIDILINEKSILKEKILNLPKGYNENGYSFDIRERKGMVNYKSIFDMFLSENNINVDDFRREKVKAIIIKEPK